MKIPTKLVDKRRSKRSGVGGPRIREYQDEHGNWYTPHQLGKFYNVTGNVIRNRIQKHEYWYEHILVPLTPQGRRLDGSRITNTQHLDAGNAEWAALGG